jgi:predicted solute-binding protein
MVKLRTQQDKSAGFLTFIPLAYQPGANGVYDRHTSAVDDLKTIAISRLMLDNFPHIKSYWVMLTAEVAPVALQFGADDMDGTVGEERIAHAAAATSPVKLAKENIIKLIRSAGKVPVERDIMYRPLEIHDRQTIGKLPYLNCVPFNENFSAKPFKLVALIPSQMGRLAERKQIEAGPLSLMDFWRVEKDFEMLDYCIAVKNIARSVTLYSDFPWEELNGKRIGITVETSTSIELLKVLLAHKYGVAARLERMHLIFQAQEAADFDAVLVIGDEALLRAKSGLAGFRFSFDLGREWHDWTKLPFVFAVWAIRRDAEPATKEALIAQLDSTVTSMPFTITDFAKWHGKRLDLTPAEVQVYLNGFVYRLGEKEKEAIEKFRDLLTLMSSVARKEEPGFN